jgi:TonB-dependent Receptor Plug Domain
MKKLHLLLIFIPALPIFAFSHGRINTGTDVPPWTQIVEQSSNLNGPGHADRVLTENQFEDCPELVGCVLNKLPGVLHPQHPGELDSYRFARNSSRSAYIKFMLDGVWVTGDELNTVNVNDVECVEVLSSGSYLSIYGAEATGGLLIITTKTGETDDVQNTDTHKNTPLEKSP